MDVSTRAAISHVV
jgi:hypothetical protein